MTFVATFGFTSIEALAASQIARMKDPLIKLAEDIRPYFVVTTTRGKVLVAKSGQCSAASHASIIARDKGYKVVSVG
jgi:phosphoenolpyruvate-protein kinase (PTS system EI component)